MHDIAYVRFLNLKPRRSLCRLRLKFEETTRVVCADYSWSLQKVLRTYKFKYAYSPKWVHVVTEMSTMYSLKCLRVLTETSTTHSHGLWYCRKKIFRATLICWNLVIRTFDMLVLKQDLEVQIFFIPLHRKSSQLVRISTNNIVSWCNGSTTDSGPVC